MKGVVPKKYPKNYNLFSFIDTSWVSEKKKKKQHNNFSVSILAKTILIM